MKKENNQYLSELILALESFNSSPGLNYQIENLANLILTTTLDNKLTAIFGNGGSAADAQHFSAELVGKYQKNNRRPFKSIALTTDTSFLTAWSNDFDFATIFERQIQAFAENIGLCIALSTSGTSINVLKGLEISNSYGISNFLITGKDCPEHSFIKNIIRLPSNDTSIVQTLSQVMYHLVCVKLEEY